MLTIFQFAEELTNQQMVDALRSRLDLKYALHLPVNYHRFEPSALCEFRRQLFADAAFQQIFQKLLDRTAEFGLLKTIRSQPVLTSRCWMQFAQSPASMRWWKPCTRRWKPWRLQIPNGCAR